NNRDFRGSAPNIHDHAANGFGNWETGTDGGGHGFFDHVAGVRTCLTASIKHGIAFNFRNSAGDADHHRSVKTKSPLGPLDEVFDHRQRMITFVDDDITQWTNRDNVGRSSAEHPLGFFAYGQRFVGITIDGHNAWFTNNNPSSGQVDEGVGGT